MIVNREARRAEIIIVKVNSSDINSEGVVYYLYLKIGLFRRMQVILVKKAAIAPAWSAYVIFYKNTIPPGLIYTIKSPKG